MISSFNCSVPPPEENPPFSRIFVHCSPHHSKELLLETFQIYGKVQSIRQITDRTNGAFKGCCFIKYEKASAAATAVENLNDKALEPNSPPLKVTYADPRGARRNFFDDGEVPPRSRLFITFLKSLSEEEIRQRFSEYGHLEYVKILKDKQTMLPRGIGFVKYSRTSSAFRALESLNCLDCENSSSGGQTLRVKLADPRPQSSPYLNSCDTYQSFPAQASYPHYSPSVSPQASHSDLRMWKNPLLPASQRIDNNNPPGSRLFFSFSKQLPFESLQQLFCSRGLLESIYLLKGKNCGYAKYSTCEAASSAAAAMNGVEIFPGIVAKVIAASPQIQGKSKHQPQVHNVMEERQRSSILPRPNVGL